MIKVAIIDDGVTQSLAENWQITANSITPLATIINTQQNRTHADICFKIIQHYLDTSLDNEILWYNIKVIDRPNMRGNVQNLLNAFSFCMDNNIQVIHLSIGTSYFGDFAVVAGAVSKLVDQGIHVIAAANNKNKITYPACLPQVIGVKHKPDFFGKEYCFNHNPYDGIQFSSSSKHYIDDEYTANSNSFAAPLITSLALNYLTINPTADFAALQKHLSESDHSLLTPTITNAHIPRICTQAKNAMIFNLCPSISLQDLNFSFSCEVINIDRFNYHSAANYIRNIDVSRVYLYIEEYTDYLEKLIECLLFLVSYIYVINAGPCEKQKDIFEKYADRILLFADFNCCNKIPEAPDIPIVVTYGYSKEKLLNLLQYLKARFSHSGYHCIVSADITLAKIMDFDVIPRAMNLVDYVNSTCNFFDGDILIIGISDNNRLHEVELLDCMLIANSVNILPDFKNNRFIWDDSVCDDTLFQNLVNMLT